MPLPPQTVVDEILQVGERGLEVRACCALTGESLRKPPGTSLKSEQGGLLRRPRSAG